ncbi:hypothetical protein GCM10027187_40440 [Streptosporangium sandarakinum]|uniref:Uncharacterized protein n=1 Tax=Streptosporangium sandarakinum TaxID=1260955 RepID=A0A852VEJ5_9ACTN|nr:hypothetical protein [Streptosporangium sandarakinum]NYF44625.1 hypothetical protein [Streptosporangium sandarakinum]
MHITARQYDQAARLGWTAAHADAIAWAAAGDLHQDARGFYRTGVRGGRGRAIARARILALETAGFLTVTGTAVILTDDGRDALAAWRAVSPAPAAEEAEDLAPLYGGREATRRYREWHAASTRYEAEVRARLEATLARAEESYAAEEERRAVRAAAEVSRRYATVWDAINAPAEEPERWDDGTVQTITGAAVEHAARFDSPTPAAAAAAAVPARHRRTPARPHHPAPVRTARHRRAHPAGHPGGRPVRRARRATTRTYPTR